MMTTLIDTHCHIDAYDNPLAVLDDARTAGIQVIAVTEDPGRYRLLRTRLGRRKAIDVELGFHPLRARGLSPHDLARFFRLLPQATWIGEIGLDFSRPGIANPETTTPRLRRYPGRTPAADPTSHGSQPRRRARDHHATRASTGDGNPALVHRTARRRR